MVKLASFADNLIGCRVVKSSRLPAKIAANWVSIGRLLCLAFLYGCRFLNKISLDWPLTWTTQPSTSKFSDNPAMSNNFEVEHFVMSRSDNALLFCF